jgi:hypothetical protein
MLNRSSSWYSLAQREKPLSDLTEQCPQAPMPALASEQLQASNAATSVAFFDNMFTSCCSAWLHTSLIRPISALEILVHKSSGAANIDDPLSNAARLAASVALGVSAFRNPCAVGTVKSHDPSTDPPAPEDDLPSPIHHVVDQRTDDANQTDTDRNPNRRQNPEPSPVNDVTEFQDNERDPEQPRKTNASGRPRIQLACVHFLSSGISCADPRLRGNRHRGPIPLAWP